MKKTLSIGSWYNEFGIEGTSIVDVMNWNPYALAEGLADQNTLVSLSLVQVSKLSNLDSETIESKWEQL